MDLTPEQRKLFQTARDAAPKTPRKAKRPSKPVPAERWFCERHYAALDDRQSCPACQGAPDYQAFCKRCLYVHLVGQKCHPWAPSPTTYRA